MAEVICKMSENLELSFEPSELYPQGPTINLGVMVEGGLGLGITPGLSSFESDIRILPGMELDTIKKEIERYLDRLMKDDPDLSVDIEVTHTLPPSHISIDEPIVRCALKCAVRVMDIPPRIGGFPGGTDAPILNELGIPSISALGPGLLHFAHGPNERVPVEDIITTTKIYALTLLDYLGYKV